MRVFYLALGRYNVSFTVGGEDFEERESVLKTTQSKVAGQRRKDVVIHECEGIPYCLERLDIISFPLESGQIQIDTPPLITTLPGVPGTQTIDRGLMLLLASTGWGKSTYMVRGMYPEFVGGGNNVRFVSFCEPFELTGEAKVRYVFRAIDLLREMIMFLNDDESTIMMIDSFRSFLYDQSVGTTGERGIDAFLPVQLTGFSNVLSILGKTCVATLNPMIDATTPAELERFERLKGSLESSVPVVITGNAHRAATLSVRGVHNANRTPIEFRVPEFDLHRQKVTQLTSEAIVTLGPDFDPILPSADVAKFFRGKSLTTK